MIKTTVNKVKFVIKDDVKYIQFINRPTSNYDIFNVQYDMGVNIVGHRFMIALTFDTAIKVIQFTDKYNYYIDDKSLDEVFAVIKKRLKGN
jgi:hypothetical protein